MPKERLYLSTTTHPHDKPILKRLDAEAAGNIQKFRDLYRNRFGFSPSLMNETEKIQMGYKDENLMVIEADTSSQEEAPESTGQSLE